MNEGVRQRLSKGAGIGAGLALLVLTGLGVVAWQMGARLGELAALGYPGIFLLMVISGGSYFPVPGPPAVAVAGAIWNPVLVGIAAGLGNSTGEMSSYLLGRATAANLEAYRKARFVAALERWLQRYGFWTVFALAAIPNPTFHALTLLAGSVGYPARRFWVALALGNCVKYAVVAYLGFTASAIMG
ncbi:MAG: YqaA family protein [Chloroflexota bacterium]